MGTRQLAQEFTLYRGLDVIEVRVTVDWHEQFKALALSFPVDLRFFKATYEIPYGQIERPADGEEEPGQSWIDLSGEARAAGVPYGLSLLNDGKYSFSVTDRDMRMTVLRSPIYAHHDPTVPEPESRTALSTGHPALHLRAAAARRRLGAGRHRAPRGRAEQPPNRAGRDLPRRHAAAARLVPGGRAGEYRRQRGQARRGWR